MSTPLLNWVVNNGGEGGWVGEVCLFVRFVDWGLGLFTEPSIVYDEDSDISAEENDDSPCRSVQPTPVAGPAVSLLTPPHPGQHPVVGELPSTENIAAMSYDELLRFAGEIGTSALD